MRRNRKSVSLNYHLNRPIAFDETGGSDRSDRKYRTEAWEWIMSGGGVYDHLDFSFTTDRPDGSAVPLPAGTPGGGGPELRKQLQVLKEFIERFDFVRMARSDAVVAATETQAHVLAEKGHAYAAYLKGGTCAGLLLELPEGRYKAEWVNTKSGKVEAHETFDHTGGGKILRSPDYAEDIAVAVRRTR